MTLTGRDREILTALASRVRMFSVEQLARTWWGEAKSPAPAALKRLRELERLELLRRFTVMAHPELPLQRPAVSWSPGQADPEAGAVAYQLQTRWTLPHVSTTVFMASRKAANHFGGDVRTPPKEVEQTHDVHVSTMFLWYRANAPADAALWHSEAWIKKSRPDAPGEKLPDAMIRRASSTKVIEFGGAYPKERLIAFHEFCKRRALPYDLW
jgi:DNA-binding Lrp family transcriptional regulator